MSDPCVGGGPLIVRFRLVVGMTATSIAQHHDQRGAVKRGYENVADDHRVIQRANSQWCRNFVHHLNHQKRRDSGR